MMSQMCSGNELGPVEWKEQRRTRWSLAESTASPGQCVLGVANGRTVERLAPRGTGHSTTCPNVSSSVSAKALWAAFCGRSC